MRTTFATVVLAGAILALPVSAEHNTTTIISGIVSNHGFADFHVGNTGTNNYLEINSGGMLTNVNAGQIGASPGSWINAVTVTDPGSVWNSSTLHIGYYGSYNTLTITNGGTVYNADGYIGYQSNANNNAVVVTSPGSAWNNSDDLYIGRAGSVNRLTITNGGTVYNADGYIGYQSNANNNTVIVTGPGSVWNNSSTLNIGLYGSGNSLTITNGGIVFNATGYVGYYSNNNTVVVTGPGSVWNNSSTLHIGYYGSVNRLTITNGGTVYNTDGYIGYESNANNNAVLVTGPGSVWNNSGDLNVGYFGSGNTLTIANSGIVFNATGYIGYYSSATNNAVTVTGTGSVWNNSDSLYVGYDGFDSRLIITNGGTLIVTNGSGSTAVLDVRGGTLTLSGGIAILDNLVVTNATGTLGFKSGTLVSRNTTINNSQPFVVGGDTNAATFYLPSGAHTFANGLIVTNNGRLLGGLTLSDPLTVAGGTVIATNGELRLQGTVTGSGNGSWRVAHNAATLSFAGGGTTSGMLLNNGGTVRYETSITHTGSIANTGAILIGPDDTMGVLLMNEGSITGNGSLLITPTGSLRLGADVPAIVNSVTNQGILHIAATAFGFNGGLANESAYTVADSQLVTIQGGLANSGGLTIQPGGALSANTISSQSGSIFILNTAQLSVGTAWTNSGAIAIQGGYLTGATLNNSGLLEGYGSVSAPLINQNGGTVRASGSLLSLNGSSIQNQAGASFEIESGATLRIGRSLNNAGDINNFGGILDVSGFILTNASVLTGSGTFKAAAIINSGQVLFQGGQADIYGVYLNTAGATTTIYRITANFHGAFTNAASAYFKNTGSDITFFGSTFIGGTYLSDPAMNTFNGSVALDATGVLAGGAGDVFVIGGDLSSANPNGLQLSGAKVVFNDGAHTFTLAGTATIGTLQLDSGTSVSLVGGDLIVGVFNAQTDQFTTAQTIYYDPSQNPSLGAQTYALNGGGMLSPVPEPTSAWLVFFGIALLLRSVVKTNRS